MDSELKDYLDNLRTDLKETVETRVGALEKRISENADTSLASHEATRKQVSALGRMVTHLWKQVKGSDPPPPADDDGNPLPNPAGKPLDEQLTDHDLTIAALQGQVINVDSKVNVVKEEMATKAHVDAIKSDLTNAIGQVAEQNDRQLKALGVRPPADPERNAIGKLVDLLVWAFKEPEGRKQAILTLGAITSLITAVGTTYALITGRLPLPNQGVSTVQMVGVPMVPTAGASTSAPAQAGDASPAHAH